MADKKSSLLSRYEDPTGEFSNQSLQMATWYAKHHEVLRKIFMYCLIVWSVITLGTSLFFVGTYFIFDYSQDQANLKNLSYSYISSQAFHDLRPEELVFSSPELFSGIENRYDVIVEATNPNKLWIATVTYQFESSDGATESNTVVVLPGSTQPLTVFGYESDRRPESISFKLLGVTWKRIDPHLISDPAEYMSARINISTSGTSYLSPNQTGGTGVPIVRFSVSNNSLFDFWEFSGIVILKRGFETVGIAPLTISQFRGGETRDISLGVVSTNLIIDSATLVPLVNVFDSDIYMTR